MYYLILGVTAAVCLMGGLIQTYNGNHVAGFQLMVIGFLISIDTKLDIIMIKDKQTSQAALKMVEDALKKRSDNDNN